MITLGAIVVGAIFYVIGQHGVAYLVAAGVVAKYFCPFLLTVTALPGRFVAFPEKISDQSKGRYVLGTVVSVLIQSYVYVAYIALLVEWSSKSPLQNNPLAVWSACFLAAIVPIAFSIKEFRKAATEVAMALQDIDEGARRLVGGPESQMLKMLAFVSSLSLLIALVGLLVFTYSPTTSHLLYGWILPV